MRVVGWAFLIFMFSGVATAETISGRVVVSGEPESKDVVVYLEGKFSGNFQPPMKNPEILQNNQVFQPTALAVTVGTTVEFPNDDDVFHNAFSFSPSNPFDFGPYGPGNEQRVQMKKIGIVEVFCDVHEHMFSSIIVLDHPYFAMAKQDRYSIKDVPAGKYTIKAFLSPHVIQTKTIEVKAGTPLTVDFRLDAKQ